MTTEALKSTAITNLDAIGSSTLPNMNSPGQGGASYLHSADSAGGVTATTGMAANSTYQLVRLPSSARLKHLFAKLDASVTTFAGNIGLYYSTSTTDGTPAALQGTIVNAGTEFGSAVDLHAQTGVLDLIQNLSAANLNKRIWEIGGESKDQGGYRDVVITLTSTTSGAPVVYAEAQYVK